MNVLIAVGHIVGSQIVLLLVAWAMWRVTTWWNGRVEKQLLEEASVHFGVPVEHLERSEMIPKLIRHSSERYSSELFRNHLSDLCGALQTAKKLGVSAYEYIHDRVSGKFELPSQAQLIREKSKAELHTCPDPP